MVELDIEDLIKDTFMEDAPIVKVSATENLGIEKLKTI